MFVLGLQIFRLNQSINSYKLIDYSFYRAAWNADAV